MKELPLSVLPALTVTILVALLTAFIAHRLSIAREAKSRRANAALSFRTVAHQGVARLPASDIYWNSTDIDRVTKVGTEICVGARIYAAFLGSSSIRFARVIHDLELLIKEELPKLLNAAEAMYGDSPSKALEVKVGIKGKFHELLQYTSET